MKGIVFTEFLEMVESAFSEAMVDRIIDKAKPASGGAYTSVGFYDHREIVALVMALSEASGTPVPDLIKAFDATCSGGSPRSSPHSSKMSRMPSSSWAASRPGSTPRSSSSIRMPSCRRFSATTPGPASSFSTTSRSVRLPI